MTPKISLVTISFNQARFLDQAIRSVIDQEYTNLEYIVVDPGSQDGSRQIIDCYRDHIEHLVFEPDTGPAQGLNHGFAHASGEIFGFLNADDFLLPDALHGVANTFSQSPGLDVVTGHGWLVDVDCRPIRRKHSDRFTAWRYLHKGAYLLQQSTFFRASAFHKAGGFNENNRTCWDGELWLDMALSGCRFGVAHDYWSCFRTYGESISGQIALNRENERSYQWDRSRMFREATGRDPAGPCYRYQCALAQFLRWFTNPIALPSRTRGVISKKLQRQLVTA